MRRYFPERHYSIANSSAARTDRIGGKAALAVITMKVRALFTAMQLAATNQGQEERPAGAQTHVTRRCQRPNN
jgi:hypothetical protein